MEKLCKTLHSFRRWYGEKYIADLVVIKPEKLRFMEEDS